jgi:hypothetical protein
LIGPGVTVGRTPFGWGLVVVVVGAPFLVVLVPPPPLLPPEDVPPGVVVLVVVVVVVVVPEPPQAVAPATKSTPSAPAAIVRTVRPEPPPEAFLMAPPSRLIGRPAFRRDRIVEDGRRGRPGARRPRRATPTAILPYFKAKPRLTLGPLTLGAEFR